MAEHIADGVYQIKVPIPITLGHINVYVLCEPTESGGIEYSLVDTGMNTNTALDTLLAELKGLGVAPTDLKRVVITHYHPDHIGLLGRLYELTGPIEVVLHGADADHLLLIYGEPQRRSQELSQWLIAQGTPVEEAGDMSFASLGLREFVSLAETTRRIEDNSPLRPEDPEGWTVLHTPGHTPGHIVLYHPTRHLLLSGDHLLAKISSNVSKYPGSQPDPLGDYIASLHKLEPLEIDLVLPAHGPTLTDHRARITYLLDHHRARMDRFVAEMREVGRPITAYELSNLIWRDRLDSFNRRLALMESVSHLERLRRDAVVIEHAADADGYVRWSLS